MYSPNSSEAITFNLRAVNSDDRYQVRNILGLDAEEILPKFYGFGLNTKARMYDLRLKPRDIILRVILNPNFRVDESYSDIRDDLYRSISAARTSQVVLHFKAGPTIVARIYGFITKFEVPYFVKLPEVQFTINCNDPLFRAINPVLFAPAQLATVNPVLLPDSLSTAPHGFTFQATFKAAAASFTIQDLPTQPEWQFVVTPTGGFLTGDVLYFSSEYLNKYCYMVRGGVTTYLMDKIAPTSVWPMIFPGQNSFQFVNLASINWNTLQYYAAYWGV
jgi:hypothetical protein